MVVIFQLCNKCISKYRMSRTLPQLTRDSIIFQRLIEKDTELWTQLNYRHGQ